MQTIIYRCGITAAYMRAVRRAVRLALRLALWLALLPAWLVQVAA